MSWSHIHDINSSARCARCKLHPALCLCAHLSPMTLRTRVEVVIHQRETVRSSNTAQLVPLTLTECGLWVHGLPFAPLDLSPLHDPSRAAFVLFPSPDSLTLEDAARVAGERPLSLVVVDGSWRQARRMLRRLDGLRGLPFVTLPAGGDPSRYAQRRQTDPSHLSTFEAIARALGVLEGPEVQRTLEAIFALKVRADMRMRGRTSGPLAYKDAIDDDSDDGYDDEG
jgi:DTW domain-containing protein